MAEVCRNWNSIFIFFIFALFRIAPQNKMGAILNKIKTVSITYVFNKILIFEC